MALKSMIKPYDLEERTYQLSNIDVVEKLIQESTELKKIFSAIVEKSK